MEVKVNNETKMLPRLLSALERSNLHEQRRIERIDESRTSITFSVYHSSRIEMFIENKFLSSSTSWIDNLTINQTNIFLSVIPPATWGRARDVQLGRNVPLHLELWQTFEAIADDWESFSIKPLKEIASRLELCQSTQKKRWLNLVKKLVSFFGSVHFSSFGRGISRGRVEEAEKPRMKLANCWVESFASASRSRAC